MYKIKKLCNFHFLGSQMFLFHQILIVCEISIAVVTDVSRHF